MIQEKQHLIEVYATLISQNETRGSAQIHEKLCIVLKLSPSDFRPFETIKYIPTYREAIKIIYDVIDDFESSRILQEMGAAILLENKLERASFRENVFGELDEEYTHYRCIKCNYEYAEETIR